MDEKLRQLIETSQRILITSHISPDPDAVSSALLAATALEANYPAKQIELVLEEKPNQDLGFLKDFETIKFQPVLQAAEALKPELILITDANNFNRVSRSQGDDLREFAESRGIHLAILDHHEEAGKDEADVYINGSFPASAQQVYETFFNSLGFKKPGGYAETAMLGILADTYRFKYANPKHRETFALVSELVEADADIEVLENKLEQYTKGQLEVVSELIRNLQSGAGYNYSFISDEFVLGWKDADKSADDFKSGCDTFVNHYIRNVQPNKWGFIVYPELTPSEKNFSVSFRSEGDAKDVSLVAARLGGGGHKPAAGAKLKAQSANEALKMVISAIENQ